MTSVAEGVMLSWQVTHKVGTQSGGGSKIPPFTYLCRANAGGPTSSEEMSMKMERKQFLSPGADDGTRESTRD